jgi:hypothetical protein
MIHGAHHEFQCKRDLRSQYDVQLFRNIFAFKFNEI